MNVLYKSEGQDQFQWSQENQNDFSVFLMENLSQKFHKKNRKMDLINQIKSNRFAVDSQSL